CPMSVKEAVLAYFGPALYEFYGSTELAVNTILRPEDVLRKPGSCGQAAPGREIALLDDDGRPVPVGEPGELYVRHFPNILDEYYKDPEATRAMRRGEGYSVGDGAPMAADGSFAGYSRKRGARSGLAPRPPGTPMSPAVPRACVVLALLALLPSPAVARAQGIATLPQGEFLFASPPEGWIVGHRSRQGNASIVEYVPAGQT